MVIFVLKGEKWYDKLLNVKYLPLFHHFKAIYQFPKHIIFGVKIVGNASLWWYLTLQGDNSLKSVERFDHMMFVCRFQASR